MIPPTCEDLLDFTDEEFEVKYHHSDTSWRHGSYETEVYLRLSDKTYWQAYFRLSTDGEINELRDGQATITQVVPVEKTIIAYEKVA